METAVILLVCGLRLQGTLPLDVVLHNSAGIAGEDLSTARRQVEAIFRQAGIAVTWPEPNHNTEDSKPFQVTVLLRQQDPNWSPKRRPVMGMALASDSRRGVTMIYYESISGVARKYLQPAPELLAITIAHEIGHLLLPHPAHASEGIMRADWEGDDLRHAALQPLRFTADEAARLRARISGVR